MPGTNNLVDGFRFVQLIDVTNESDNLDSEIAYWRQRTIELDRKHGIGQGGYQRRNR